MYMKLNFHINKVLAAGRTKKLRFITTGVIGNKIMWICIVKPKRSYTF